MNRRAILKCIIAVSFIPPSAAVHAEETWIILGKRVLKPNTRAITFAINRETAGISKLGIELKGNSVWLYDLRITDIAGKANTRPINLNIPPISKECSPLVSILNTGGQPRTVALNLECLPLTSKPTEILLWGST